MKILYLLLLPSRGRLRKLGFSFNHWPLTSSLANSSTPSSSNDRYLACTSTVAVAERDQIVVVVVVVVIVVVDVVDIDVVDTDDCRAARPYLAVLALQQCGNQLFSPEALARNIPMLA